MLNLRLKPATYLVVRAAANAQGISPAAYVSNMLDAMAASEDSPLTPYLAYGETKIEAKSKN